MNQKFLNLMKHRAMLPTGVGLVSFGAGALVSHYLTKMREGKKWMEAMEGQVLVDVNVEIVEDDEDVDPNQLKLAFEEKSDSQVHEIKEYRLRSVNLSPIDEALEGAVEIQEPETIETNIFDGELADWDWDHERRAREDNPEEPYVITYVEFYGDEMEWDNQQSLTWYELDDILTNERDQVIYNYKQMIGPDLPFGHGSNDPDIVYIRNPRLEAEYEVIRNRSSYEKEVIGQFQEEIAHSQDLKHSHRLGKFPLE